MLYMPYIIAIKGYTVLFLNVNGLTALIVIIMITIIYIYLVHLDIHTHIHTYVYPIHLQYTSTMNIEHIDL